MVSEMRAIYLPMPAMGRLEKLADSGPPVPIEHLYNLMDAIDAIATQTGRSVPWIALNWHLQRPIVSSVILGARNEVRLADLVIVDGNPATNIRDIHKIEAVWHRGKRVRGRVEAFTP